jgi:hypothetical protein
LIIFSPDNQSDQYQQTLINLAKDPLGIDKRGIVIFEVFVLGGIQPDNTPLSEEEVLQLREFFKVGTESFLILFLDKNKTEIFRSNELMNSKEMLEVFD